MRDTEGAILIHDRQDDRYIGMVGTEEKGNVILFPWNKDWYYYGIGTTKLAYISRK